MGVLWAGHSYATWSHSWGAARPSYCQSPRVRRLWSVLSILLKGIWLANTLPTWQPGHGYFLVSHPLSSEYCVVVYVYWCLIRWECWCESDVLRQHYHAKPLEMIQPQTGCKFHLQRKKILMINSWTSSYIKVEHAVDKNLTGLLGKGYCKE